MIDAPLTADAYLMALGRLVRPLGEEGAALQEAIAAHLAEAAAMGEPTPQTIARLGTPAELVQPLLADRWLEQASRDARPGSVARGLWHAVLAGGRRALLATAWGLGYLLLAVFTAMALLRPVLPRHVGLFRSVDGALSFGILSDTAGAVDLLGAWTLPVALALAGLAYLLLTRGLRLLRRRR